MLSPPARFTPHKKAQVQQGPLPEAIRLQQTPQRCCGSRKVSTEAGEGSRSRQESQSACRHLSRACTLVNPHRVNLKSDDSTRGALVPARLVACDFPEQSASITLPCPTGDTCTHVCAHTHTRSIALKGRTTQDTGTHLPLRIIPNQSK